MGRVKAVGYEITSIKDGVNNTDPGSDVGRRYIGADRNSPKNGLKQVQDALDFMLHTKKQRPGSQGLTNSLATYCKGLGTYLKHDGTDTLLTVTDGKLYSVNKTTGELTELYNITGSGEAWFADYLDVCFVCNGTKVVKVESATVAYQVGITAPAGASAAPLAGGSLPLGEYHVYISYARKVSTSNVLYSVAQDLGTVTLSGGNQSIRISTFANSGDAQVNNKIVWLLEPGGVAIYFYHQTNDNTTTTVDVTAATSKSTSLIYTVQAATNYAVPAFEYIAVLNNYLYGSVANVLYRSRQAGDRYQLERFDTSATGNKATYPFDIQGIFTIGADLYLNTPAGIIRVPNGDIEAQFDHVEKQDFFKYERTVQPWNGGLIGLTAKKFGFFDGEKIHPFDMAQDIKPWISKVYSGATTNFLPAGCIYRRSNRTEYHLLYRDSSIGALVNNRRLVLNLDTFQVLGENDVRAAWEMWSNGGNYMVVDSAGIWYCAQSAVANSVIYREHQTQNKDVNVFVGNTYTASKEYGWSFKVGSFITSLPGIIRWVQMYVLAKMVGQLNVTIDMEQSPPNIALKSASGNPAGSSRYGVARYGINRYATEGAVKRKIKLPRSLKGYPLSIVFSQTVDDQAFELLQAQISGVLTESRFT